MNKKETYRRKAIESFGTKFNLFIFKKALHGNPIQFDQSDFQRFEIDQTLVDEYTTVYWQLKADNQLVWSSGKEHTINDLYKVIMAFKKDNQGLIDELRKHYITYDFPKRFSYEDFEKLTNQDHCAYCGITSKMIEELGDEKRMLRKKNLRGWSLEIDRKDSNLEYSYNNCVMACYWCNNAKTDEFTPEEFLPIGKAIGQVWASRFNTQ